MYKNSRSTVLLPLVVAAAVALGIFLGQFLGRSSAESDIKGILRSLALPQNKVSQTLSLIETQYVDSVAIDSLVERALPVIVSELDPHSVYIPASEMAEINEPLDGEFDGIGVVFNMATDTVIVLNVIPSGPSDKAGVVAGDRIVRINDSLVAGQQIAQREIMRRLRGKRGSEVRLGLERRGIDELVEVTVVRDKIPIRSLTAALMLTGDIAFVKLDQFARTSHTELLEALSTLRTQGMRKLILDLRGNSGGFLDQAIAIANEFLPADKLIVYTEDRNHQRIEQYSDGTGSAADLDLAVLVDEGSASSSEILAGALQDNDRGTIIGRRTFGKGLVQEQIPFPDGSAVRLTIARYYTPSGRSIQKPYDKGSEDYNNDLMNRYEHNEMFSADSIHFADSLKYFTAGGRTVYGGGGIMPDRFVPADTTDITPYLREVTGRNILYRFTIEYADRHRNELNRITTLPELDAFFAKDPGLLSEFIRYAARAGVAPKPSQIERSKAIILSQIKAYVGRNTPLEDNAFYHALQGIDSTVQQALKEMSAPKAEQALNTAEHE